MPVQIITAVKENTRGIRRKLLVVGGIVVAVIGAGLLLHQLNSEPEINVFVLDPEDSKDEDSTED